MKFTNCTALIHYAVVVYCMLTKVQLYWVTNGEYKNSNLGCLFVVYEAIRSVELSADSGTPPFRECTAPFVTSRFANQLSARYLYP